MTFGSVSRVLAIACVASAVVTLGACATSPSSVVTARPATQTIGSEATGSIRIAPGSGPDVTTLPFPMAQVWTALPIALDSLSIPLSRVDPAQHVIGNDAFKIRQRLGKSNLSRYLDCGQAQIGPNADSYDVMLTVLVQLQSAGESTTKVSTSVQAAAKPVTYNQGYSQCSTKGELETRLLNIVKAQLQR
ncbi:MAG: hypothetical protein ABIW79_00095 [Gemmatimonas sp.]